MVQPATVTPPGVTNRRVLATTQVGIGLALGIPAAIWAGKLMINELFGVKPWDPVWLTLATLLLCVAGLLASVIPAPRAARVAPMPDEFGSIAGPHKH
jgi:hypothetical protein